MIASFRSRALSRFWIKGDSGAVSAEWRGKLRILLSTIEAARLPTDLDKPGFGFHALSGDRAGRFAVSVSRNWCLTFGWDGEDATQLELEDYHGR
jgi:proteic killer suppression protein